MNITDSTPQTEQDEVIKRLAGIAKYGQRTMVFDDLREETVKGLIENKYTVKIKIIDCEKRYIVTLPDIKQSKATHEKKWKKLKDINYKEIIIMILGTLLIYYLCIKIFHI